MENSHTIHDISNINFNDMLKLDGSFDILSIDANITKILEYCGNTI